MSAQQPLFHLFEYHAHPWKPPYKRSAKTEPALKLARERAEQTYTPILSLHLVRERAIEHAVQIKAPKDAYELVKPYFEGLVQEHLVVLTLNTKNHVIALVPVYVGSVHTTVVRLAELFRPALLTNASAILVLHNHPSGDATPSPEDAAITREIVKAGQLLDIDVLDHLVIGDTKFVSLKERGLGF